MILVIGFATPPGAKASQDMHASVLHPFAQAGSAKKNEWISVSEPSFRLRLCDHFEA